MSQAYITSEDQKKIGENFQQELKFYSGLET